MSRTCVVVGDVMMDVTARIWSPIEYASDTPAKVSVQPGGSAATTAAWLASGGCPTIFVGCVGDDAFGRDIRDSLVAAGVDARLTVASGLTTGTCIIVVDQAHERTMLPDRGANDALDPAAFAALELSSGHHVHVSGYALLNDASRAAGMRILELAVDAGASVSLDPASAGPLRDCRELILGVLSKVDLIIANEDEAAILTGAADAAGSLRLLAELVPTAVIKRGGRGVMARDASGSVDQPAPATDVVDTTGAGDAFAAGFLASWMAGEPLDEATSAGQRLAAVAVGRVGAGRPGL